MFRANSGMRAVSNKSKIHNIAIIGGYCGRCERFIDQSFLGACPLRADIPSRILGLCGHIRRLGPGCRKPECRVTGHPSMALGRRRILPSRRSRFSVGRLLVRLLEALPRPSGHHGPVHRSPPARPDQRCAYRRFPLALAVAFGAGPMAHRRLLDFSAHYPALVFGNSELAGYVATEDVAVHSHHRAGGACGYRLGRSRDVDH